MTRRKIGGYIWYQAFHAAKGANGRARRALQRIVDERPGPTQMARYLAETSLALAESWEAIDKMERIASNNGAAPDLNKKDKKKGEVSQC